MTTQPDAAAPRRPLSRERVLQAAIDLADRDGLEALTMRSLATDLGVEAMSLYHHVRNKDALLDGVVDTVVAEINAAVPPLDGVIADDWQAALRTRILVAREVLLRHRWAPGLIETRASISSSVMRYFDDVLGLLRAGGFSYDLAHHALHALGSRALGFTQELFAPDDGDVAASDEENLARLTELAAEVPHLVAMMAEISHEDADSTLGWCDDQAEFEFGLDLLLDGLEQRRRAGTA